MMALADTLTDVIQRAIAAQLFPGIEVLVARHDRVLLHRAWGTTTPDAAAPPLERGCCFDIASLTKPVATALCLMRLVERGELHLEASLCEYFAAFDTPQKRSITLLDLLTHRSGLSDWIDLRPYPTPQQARQALLESPLIYPPRTRVLYSDVGYMLLGMLLEQRSAKPLAAWFADEVAACTDPTALGFGSVIRRGSTPIIPSAHCSWRNKWLHGEVHDENAHVLGGVAGHAGLFGSAPALHRFSACLLHDAMRNDPLRDDAMRSDPPRNEPLRNDVIHSHALHDQTPHSDPVHQKNRPTLLAPASAQAMFRNHNRPDLPPRGIGWDIKPSAGYSSCGDLFAPGSIGHTAFTGPSLWIDPHRGWIVIILAHRVAYSKWGQQAAWVQLRPKLHNLLLAHAQHGDGNRC